MVVCSRCGNENPLGKVFCIKCGTKLDLVHMTSEHVVEIKKHWSDPIVHHWQMIVTVLAILIVAMIGLAMWPSTLKIGKDGTRADGKRVDTGLVVMRNLRPGEIKNIEFSEQNINGYFEFYKKTIGADFVRVAVQKGYFDVRIVKTLTTIPIPKYQVDLKLSYDIRCVPRGKIAFPQQVKIGHLPVIGPIKTSVLQKVLMMFRKETEWASLNSLSDLKADQGKLILQVKK